MAKTESKIPKSDQPELTEAPAPAPKRGKTEPESTEPKFWRNMRKIEMADWGSRANIYLYRVEPITDRLRGGDKKYIMCYGEPITEDRVMIDQGSGRYKAMLTFKKPASDTTDEMDSVYFDILNPKFPPKIPPGEWCDDPRNKKWAWAKQYVEVPAAAPPTQTPLSSVVEIMQATNDMRKTAMEEMKQNAPPAPSPPTADPMTVAMGFAEKLLTMRAENPMLSVLEKMLLASQAEAAAQRDRVDKLLEKMAEKNNAPDTKTDPAAMMKGLFDGFKSLRDGAAEMLPSSGGRGRMGSWQEFFQPVLPSIMDMLKPVAIAVTQAAMTPNPSANGPQRIQQTPGAAAQPQPRDFGAFLDDLTPRMLHFLRDFDDPAATFAEWFHDGYADSARAIETMISLGGVPALMAWYRTSKHWPTLAPIEAEFTKFLTDVIAWLPKPDDAEPPANATEEVIDLEAETTEAN